MKRYTYYYCLLILSLFILLPGMTSCADEWAEQQTGKRPMNVVEGLEGTLSLSFSSYDFESKTTSLTRASSDAEDDEQHLHSIYVFVIDMAKETEGAANCPILARKFFSDITGKLESVTENGTAWNVIDLQMKAISCSKAAILAIANLGYSEMQHVENDSQLLNRCDSISTLEELNALTAQLSAEDGLVNVERMQGHYLMSGFYADFSSEDNLHYLQSKRLRVALQAESNGTLSLWDSSDETKQFRPLGTSGTGNPPGAIILHRLDSKVTFNIQPGGELKNTKGAYFRLTSWQVKNVPTQERIHWYDAGEPHSHTVQDSKVFQRDITETADSAWTFTFYQFENCSTERANGATDNSKGYRLIDANGIATQYNMEYALTGGEKAISGANVTSAFSNKYPNDYSQFAYTLRDLNEKEGYTGNDGEAYVTNGGFSYAPKNATYVVLTGEYYNPEEPVRRRKDDARNTSEFLAQYPLAAYPYLNEKQEPVATVAEAAKRTRTANVTYYIHLGYVGGGNFNRTLDEVPASITTFEQFGKKVNDYNILRNHHYTYTITVAGVNNIKVEATREDGGNIYEQEKQTGAEGAVVESQHFFNLDAHYETRNVTIDFERMPQNYTGYGFLLSTPYDYVQAKMRQKEDGTFEVINNSTENAITDIRGLDLDWIHFAWHGTDANPNRSLINETTGNGISYSKTYGGYTTQQTYNDTEGKLRHDKDTEHPYYLMNSAEFIKHVWNQYQSWVAAGRPDAQKTRTYTIYVDEFYYDNNPVSGSNVNWTSFCNRSPRQVFFFMEDKEISADQHSTYVDAHIVISQQSIQTPYATSTAGGQVIADVAFGIEHLDEFQAKYNRSESDEHGFASGATRQNGLYNAMLWFKNNNTTTWEEAESYYTDNARIYVPKQADYLSENGDDKGRENRKGALAVFSRNRDLNRDGKLDDNEIRWFVPALDQYMVCFLGGRPAFENPIYESSRAIKTEGNTTIVDYLQGTPIQHYITSTGGKQRIYWAEEGCAYGIYGASKDWGCYGIRMARMLRQNGLDDTGSAFTTLNKDLLVQDQIFIVSKSRNGQAITYKSDELVYGENYYITLNKLNTNAFRDYVASGDLAQHTHEQKNNWLYREYKIAKNKIGYTSWTDDTYDRTPKIDGTPRTWWQLNGVWTNTGEAATYYNNKAGLFYAGPTTTLAYEYTESGNGDDLHRWRVPNLREMAIMNMAFPAAWFNCSASGSSYCTRTRSDNLGPKYYTGSQGKRIPYFRVTDNDITRIPDWSNSGFQYIRPIHDIR